MVESTLICMRWAMTYLWNFNLWNFNSINLGSSFSSSPSLVFIFVILGVLGLFVGSFLNVVADRVATGESFLIGRSHCDFCHTKLRAKDLIPVFSFLFSGGKCRYCGHKLSWAYPLSEIFTSLVFILAYALDSLSNWNIAFLLLVFSTYIAIFLADAKYQIIPDVVVLPVSIVVTLTKLAFLPIAEFGLNFGTAVVLAGFFVALHVVTKGKGMGLGDAKLGFLVGIFHPFPQNVEVVFGAFVIGAIYSIFLLILGKAGLKSRIAFGPFLILSSFLVLIETNFLPLSQGYLETFFPILMLN